MSDVRVPIYEVRIGTEINAVWEYISEPSEWLTKVPWATTEEIRMLHKNSHLPVYFRRRYVTKEEAYEIEEAYRAEINGDNW